MNRFTVQCIHTISGARNKTICGTAIQEHVTIGASKVQQEMRAELHICVHYNVISWGFTIAISIRTQLELGLLNSK